MNNFADIKILLSRMNPQCLYFSSITPGRIYIFWLDSIRLISSHETQRNKTHKRTPNTQRKITWVGIEYCNVIHKNSKNYQEAPLHDRKKTHPLRCLDVLKIYSQRFFNIKLSFLHLLSNGLYQIYLPSVTNLKFISKKTDQCSISVPLENTLEPNIFRGYKNGSLPSYGLTNLFKSLILLSGIFVAIICVTCVLEKKCWYFPPCSYIIDFNSSEEGSKKEHSLTHQMLA